MAQSGQGGDGTGGPRQRAQASATGRGRRALAALAAFVAVAALAWLLRGGSGPSAPAEAPTPDTFSARRAAMVEQDLEGRDVSDETVLAAMRAVPRHEFVPESSRGQAYDDHPLSIGYGQTISQPYIVALMTQLLRLSPGDRVLEVGTGSGYQAAVLAEITDEVFSVEIIPELAAEARERLDRLGYARIISSVHDGYYGWEEHAPYDAIIVTAAPDHVPASLVEQLAEGGRLAIPVGPQGFVQTLWLIEKTPEGLKRTSMGSVLFVPLTGKH